MTGTTQAKTSTEPTSLAAVAPAAKSKPETIRQFERALREMGFTQRESASIAKGGFKAISNDVPQEGLSELAALLERNTSLLKETK